jgi:hypothetical protein
VLQLVLLNPRNAPGIASGGVLSLVALTGVVGLPVRRLAEDNSVVIFLVISLVWGGVCHAVVHTAWPFAGGFKVHWFGACAGAINCFRVKVTFLLYVA